MSSPNRSTKKRSVVEKGGVDNGTSDKKMREEAESKIPGIKQEETGEVPDMLKQETGEETDALKQETDDEMDALKHETDDEMEEEDDVNSPPLPPLPGASEGTLNADSNGDLFQAGEDGDNAFFGGDDSAGSNIDANTSQASDSYNRNGASSGGLSEAQPCVGIANPNNSKQIAKWNDRYFELFDYKEKHGNCNMPKKYEPNKPLGIWVNKQRQNYRFFNEGIKSLMTEERIAKLNEIGFVWEANEAAWTARFAELVAYEAKHGHCNFPTTNENNKQLGNWVAKQRAQYRLYQEGKKSSMTKERIVKLNEIGFEWQRQPNGKACSGNKNIAKWNDRYFELIEYKEEHGDCNVSQLDVANKKLGGWVGKQRTQYRYYQEGKKSQMTKERIAKLNEIGFEWDALAMWNDRYSELIEYKEKQGDCNVPAKYEPNKQLARWVKQQRLQYRLLNEGETSSMTEARITKLNEIDFVWDALLKNDDAWEAKLAELVAYKEAHGDCLVPNRYGPLGTWVHTQRQFYRRFQEGKKSSMTAERIEKLNDIGFKWKLRG